jgi:hypothetical protein
MPPFSYSIIAAPPITAKIPPNPAASLPAPLLWLVVVTTEVATAPKEVVAPAEFTRTLLVTPLMTVTEVVNPAGMPVEVTVTLPWEIALDLAVVIAVVTAEDEMTDLIVETGEEVVATKEEDERGPSQDPDTQVLNAHSESEAQVAPVFPQSVMSMEFTA